MNARVILALFVTCYLLCGCETYRYVFDTTIGDDGSIERTITFTHDKKDQEGAAKTDGEEPPNRGLPSNLVIPDKARFERFDWIDNGLTGTWRSKGAIESDFRMTVKAYTPRGTTLDALPEHPSQPEQTREAYNDGTVTVTNLVLVKTYTLVEQFRDYYSRREFEKHGDLAIDLLTDIALETLHKDFAGQYDFGAFDTFVRDMLVPLAKEHKGALYGGTAVRGGVGPMLLDRLPADRLALRSDLIRLGALDDPFADNEQLFESCGEWILNKMCDTVKDKTSGLPLPLNSLKRYFKKDKADEESAFTASAEALLDERYGNTDEADEPMDLATEILGLYRSFGQIPDVHSFEIAVTAPGIVVYTTPKADSAVTIGGLSSVKWTFDDSAFFPGGVTLGLITAAPDDAAQTGLLGRAALTTDAQVRRYVFLLQELGEQRDDVLGKLRAGIKQQSLVPFAEYARSRLPNDWSPEAEDQPPLGELLLLLQGLAEKSAGE